MLKTGARSGQILHALMRFRTLRVNLGSVGHFRVRAAALLFAKPVGPQPILALPLSVPSSSIAMALSVSGITVG